MNKILEYDRKYGWKICELRFVLFALFISYLNWKAGKRYFLYFNIRSNVSMLFFSGYKSDICFKENI